MTKQDKKNAYLYCKFRDEQFALYDEYAKKHGILMNTFLVLNVLYYAKEGMTQKDICERTFNSKQTVSLIVKKLLQDGHVVIEEDIEDKRNKKIVMTEQGRLYAKIPVEHITKSEDIAMSMFTPEEQELLINLSKRFTNNLTTLVNTNEEEIPLILQSLSQNKEE